MAYFRCLGNGGGGLTKTFTPVIIWDESGIGASAWKATDDATTMTVNRGNYANGAVAGSYVESSSSNPIQMSFPVTSSYYLFGVVVEVNPNFTPRNAFNWYECSCILGQELGGEQRDYAIVIDRNGYFALGWANSTVTSSDVSALDGQKHELMMLAESQQIHLFIDGIKKVTVDKGMNGGNMDNIGVLWNKSNDLTRVDAKIYAVGYWTEIEPTIEFDLPSLL